MKLTKFEHACFTVELDGSTLVVDPGGFTTDFITPSHVVAVVVTHEHQDHFNIEQLQKIIDRNPNALIIGHDDVVSKLENFNTKAVHANEGIKIGPFELEFYGGKHALIDPSIPIITNVGVLINNCIYHPGDSFVSPNIPVSVLALPISAPWLKTSEIVAFANEVNPERIFPTHDALLSEVGKDLMDRIVPELTKQTGATYQRLHEPIELI